VWFSPSRSISNAAGQLLTLAAPPQLSTWQAQVASDIQFIGDVNAAGHDPLNYHDWSWPSNFAIVAGDWCYDGVDWWKATQDGTTAGSRPGFAGSLVSLTGTANNTSTITMASTAGVSAGMTISGQGIKPGTLVNSVVANTSVTLNDTAQSGGNGAYIFGPSALADNTTAWRHIFRITLNFLDTVWGDGSGSGYSFGGAQSWVRWGKGKSGSGAGTYSYYDLAMTAWAWYDYVTRTGYWTANQAKLAQSIANQYIDDYIGVKMEIPNALVAVPDYWLFFDGLVEDLKRTTGRYRFNSVVTTAILKQIQDANNLAGSASPQWNVQGTQLFGSWYWNQDYIRENGYTALASILMNQAGYSYAGNVGDNYEKWTLDGVTDSCMRWILPALAERLHGAMTVTQVTIPCTLTNGSNVVTTSSSVAGIYQGSSIASASTGAAVTGTGIPLSSGGVGGTEIAHNGITLGSPNSITLTQNATVSGVQNLTFYVRGVTAHALDSSINGGFQPFFNGVAIIYPLIKWMEVEIAAGRDPSRFWSDQSIGSTPLYIYTWSKTTTHGACRPWPTIFSAIEDYCYWLRNTATSQAGDPIYRSVDQGYLLQWTSAGGSSAATDLNQLATVGFTWVAQQLVNGASGQTGATAYQFVQWADDSFNGMLNGVGGAGPFRDRVYNSGSNGGCYIPGKQFNERNKFAMTQYLARRNAISGRND
jgi:hypothetical protein